MILILKDKQGQTYWQNYDAIFVFIFTLLRTNISDVFYIEVFVARISCRFASISLDVSDTESYSRRSSNEREIYTKNEYRKIQFRDRNKLRVRMLRNAANTITQTYLLVPQNNCPSLNSILPIIRMRNKLKMNKKNVYEHRAIAIRLHHRNIQLKMTEC